MKSGRKSQEPYEFIHMSYIKLKATKVQGKQTKKQNS